MIFYSCPKCQAQMASPDGMAGQAETCPECGNLSVVPGGEREGSGSSGVSTLLKTNPSAAQATRSVAKRALSPIRPLAIYAILLMILGLGLLGLVVAFFSRQETIALLSISLVYASLGLMFWMMPIALANNKRRRKDIVLMTCISLLVLPVWLVALCWSMMDEPAGD